MIALLELRPYTGDRAAPSPNHGVRQAPMIYGIVLHATADAGHEGRALAWMCSPTSRVSCHLLVGRGGDVTRLVGDQQRAWHAGEAWWRGTRDVNSVTLGIELANRNDGERFTDAQYGRVAEIVAHYCRQGLALADVVSHAAVAPGRRTDPLGWDWDRFRAMVQHRLEPLDSAPPRVVPAPLVERQDVESPSMSSVAQGEAPQVEALPQSRERSRVLLKPAMRRRHFWVHGLTLLAAGAVMANDTLDLVSSVGLTMPEHITRWALVGIGLVNILLRVQPSSQPTCGQSVVAPAVRPRSARGTREGGTQDGGVQEQEGLGVGAPTVARSLR